VVRALVTLAEGAGFKTQLVCTRDFSITLSVRSAVNGYLTVFRPGEGERQ